MSVRGIPDQDLPENQDPDVMYTVDQMTGEKTKFGKDGKPVEDKKPEKKAATSAKKEATQDGARTSEGDRK